MKKVFYTILALLTSATFVNVAQAGSATGALAVKSSIGASCALSSTNVNFGTFSPSSAGTRIYPTGSITSTCTKSTAYKINLSTGVSGSYDRRMKGATSTNTDLLIYNLDTDSTYTTVFGDGTGISANVSAVGTGSAQTTTVYGTMPTNQFITPDNYSDNITVTLAY